jgi:hypothetical protein
MASLGSAGTLALVSATPSSAANPTCTDSWKTAISGTWSTAADWSTGSVPTSTDVACINLTGTYTVTLNGGGSAGTLILGGPSGAQTLAVQGAPSVNTTLTLSAAAGSDIETHGVLELDTPANDGYAALEGGSGVTLTNNGTFKTLDATTNTDYIEANLVNNGTVSIAGASTHQDEGTTTTNNGTFTVTSAGDLALSAASSFTNSGGTLADSGTVTLNNSTFTQSGGVESGNTVALSNSSTLDDSAGGGLFSFENTDTLSGTIPTGQTVSVLGVPTVNSGATLASAGVTNNGTFVLDAQSNGGYARVNGGTLTNNGTFKTLDASTETDYIESNLTNDSDGTVSIAGASTRQDEATATTNNGSFTVANGGNLALSGGSTLTNGATGTLGVTVNGTSGTGGISGPGLTLAGTLGVTTVGSPALGTIFTPITGPVAGAFSSLAFGPNAYVVSYPSGAVELTTATPFTLKDKKVTAHEDLPFSGTVATYTPGSQSGPVYAASINWGDGSSPTVGKVTSSGVTGKHTYSATGSYQVTVTLSNQFGTEETVTSQATVSLPPAPTVTGVSPAIAIEGKTLTLSLTGTEFTTNSTSGVAFSAAGVTIDSVIWKSPTSIQVKVALSKTATTGVGNVSVTTPGGTGICAGCLAIDAPPRIKSIAGGPLAPGTTTTVTVKGTGYQSGLNVTTDITGATVGAVSSFTSTSFNVGITVPSGTAAGDYSLTVINPDGGKTSSTKLAVS